jgi:hypothetical protein
MSDKKETAVEWLFNQIPDHLRLTRSGFEMLQQALEMEKQQIIDANITGMEFIPVDPNKYMQDAEQYYKETYNNI